MDKKTYRIATDSARLALSVERNRGARIVKSLKRAEEHLSGMLNTYQKCLSQVTGPDFIIRTRRLRDRIRLEVEAWENPE